MALLASPAYSQDPSYTQETAYSQPDYNQSVYSQDVSYNQGSTYDSEACCNDAPAYEDGGYASRMSAWLPIGALVVAGVLIATTKRHGHSSSSSCRSPNCSSSHSSHSHYTCGCSS